MNPVQTVLAVIALHAGVACNAWGMPDIWYEDNNLGRAGGMPADFIEKFRKPETFSQASRHIDVYLMRANVLNRQDDAFLSALLVPYLRRNNIALAINAGGATWTQAPGRHRALEMNMRLLRRLKGLGIEVRYISLQSVLSKPLVRNGAAIDYPMSKRIEDVVTYSKAARAIYPGAEIGIIDALPSHGKDYRRPYRELRDAMAANQIGLSYIHVDMPFEFPHEKRNGVTWQNLREVEKYVEEELGLEFGFFTTSRTGGLASSKAFHERVMAALDCYAGAAGTPRDLVIASWFPNPKETIPDTASGDSYPAMRTVLEFGKRLERKRSDRSWGVSRTSDPAWRSLCVAY